MEFHKKFNLSQISCDSIDNNTIFANKTQDIVLDRNKSASNIACLSNIIPIKKIKKDNIRNKKLPRKSIESKKSRGIKYESKEINSKSLPSVTFQDRKIEVKKEDIKEIALPEIINHDLNINQEVIETDLNESGYYLSNIEENNIDVNRIEIPFKTITKIQVNDGDIHSIIKYIV